MKSLRFTFPVLLGAALVVLSHAAAAAPSKIYFTDGGFGGPIPDAQGLVRAVNPDGSGLQTLVTGLDRPRGIAVDSVNGFLFWNDWGNEVTQMSRLDGSGVGTVLNHGQEGLNDIALDVAARKIYIGMSVSFEPFHGVKRFNYDGSDPEFIVDVEAEPGCGGGGKGSGKGPSCGWFVDGVGVDPVNGHVYYGDVGVLATPDRGIGRANLDGSGQVQLVPHLNGRGRGMGLDVAGGKMYFAEHTTGGGKGIFVGQIWRANLNGSALEVIVPNLNRPRDVALDLTEGHIYWADEELGIIGRANLDGSNVVTIVSGLAAPDSLDLYFEPDITIPTLGHFGLMLMALLIAALGVVGLRRRG